MDAMFWHSEWRMNECQDSNSMPSKWQKKQTKFKGLWTTMLKQ
jgi:hypothetical protein